MLIKASEFPKEDIFIRIATAEKASKILRVQKEVIQNEEYLK